MRSHLVALSFSGRVPGAAGGRRARIVAPPVAAGIAIWAGGEMTRRIRKALPGVLLVPDIAGHDRRPEGVARAMERRRAAAVAAPSR